MKEKIIFKELKLLFKNQKYCNFDKGRKWYRICKIAQQNEIWKLNNKKEFKWIDVKMVESLDCGVILQYLNVEDKYVFSLF